MRVAPSGAEGCWRTTLCKRYGLNHHPVYASPLGALARLEQDVEQQQVRSGPDSLELLRIVGRTSTQLSTMWGGSDARHKQGPRSLVRIQETVMVPFGLKPQVDGDF